MDSKNVVVCDNGTGVPLSLSLSLSLSLHLHFISTDPTLLYISLFNIYVSSNSNTIVLIIEFKIQYVKCGFAGENFPTSVFPCVVGRPMLRYEESLTEQELKVCMPNITLLLIFIRSLEADEDIEKLSNKLLGNYWVRPKYGLW